MPIFLAPLATLLTGMWAAAWPIIFSIVGVRFLVMSAFTVAWVTTWVAMTAALHALFPDVQASTGALSASANPLMAYVLSWMSYLKPSGFETYISAILTGYITLVFYGVTSDVLKLKASS